MTVATGVVDLTVKRHDTLPTFICILKGGDGNPADLTGVGTTVRFHMADRKTGAVKVNAAAVIVNPTATPGSDDFGKVSYTWQAVDLDTAGFYRAEWEVKFPNNSIETFPDDTDLLIKVVADVA